MGSKYDDSKMLPTPSGARAGQFILGKNFAFQNKELSDSSMYNNKNNGQIPLPKSQTSFSVDKSESSFLKHIPTPRLNSDASRRPGNDTFTEGESSAMVEVLIDDDGFLIDKEGQRILDDQGQFILLSDEQIEALQQNNLYEEERIS